MKMWVEHNGLDRGLAVVIQAEDEHDYSLMQDIELALNEGDLQFARAPGYERNGRPPTNDFFKAKIRMLERDDFTISTLRIENGLGGDDPR